MSSEEFEGLIARLRQLGSEGLSNVVGDLLANDSARRAVGRAGEAFMANKGRFDKSVDNTLDLLNLPSKRDVRELKARIDHLSGQILNLNMKLDRLLAAAGASTPTRRRKATR